MYLSMRKLLDILVESRLEFVQVIIMASKISCRYKVDVLLCLAAFVTDFEQIISADTVFALRKLVGDVFKQYIQCLYQVKSLIERNS